MSNSIRYIEADALASILLDKAKLASLNLSIFDVRNESEYAEGHIRGSVNHPSANWSSATFVETIMSNLSSGVKPKTVVMHCAYSQQRGPTCARILQNHVDRLSDGSKDQCPTM